MFYLGVGSKAQIDILAFTFPRAWTQVASQKKATWKPFHQSSVASLIVMPYIINVFDLLFCVKCFETVVILES